MTRIACMMMQKDENLLLRPWLLYHGYLFGFDNLYVYDNGSSSASVLRTLEEFAPLGVHVELTKNKPEDFDQKGKIIGDRIKEFKETNRYNIALPLDCDEFLAVNGSNGISCNRSQILDEIERICHAGVSCRTDHCLDNRPGFVDLFRYIGHVKSVVIVRQFLGIDHGFHQATLPSGQDYGSTSLIHLHFHFRPFAQTLENSRNKLGPYVDVSDRKALEEFDGVGKHLKKYFFMSEKEFYTELHGYRLPLVRFVGLGRLLNALMDYDQDFCQPWEAGRPDGVLDSVLEIDLDRFPFEPAAYLEANSDVGRANMDPWGHFLTAGYQEGRALEASHAGSEEAVERMATIRAKKRDGVAGYVGLALVLRRAGRCAEADRILADAVKQFGGTPQLLRELCLSAGYQGSYDEAAQRWGRFRLAFPNSLDGYYFGAIASQTACDLKQANEVVFRGLSLFPDHSGLRAVLADLAMRR